MAEPRGEFADLLRELRGRAGLTQQELANAADLSLRRVNGLERGVAGTPQRETVRLLADALSLIGPERDRFETAARGRPLDVVSAAAAAAAIRSLPRDVASFTGRQRELQQLVEVATGAGGVVGVHAIGGMAGVGKTAFAVHAAHRLASRFPGGQIFLQLHGHTPGRQPVDPADALASLLLAVGVPAGQIPPGLEARAAAWRDRVADSPLLLVIDDAAGSEQVQPLLPGAGGSLVLVTSRRHLSALDDATAISLDTLPSGDAAALLVRLAGRAGLSPSDPGVGEIAELCGYLPLAVGMVARQLRHHPAWSAAGRAAELASARDRLGLMETENLSVAAAFDLSYAGLTEDQQRLFRRLGLHPGADADAYAAAALDGTSLSAARGGLEALYDQYLLAEPAQGRYRLHDLLRQHARALADRLDQEDDRDEATGRLLDYYQRTAAIANARIDSRTHQGEDAESGGPCEVPLLADQEQALAWARVERASLLACLDYAAGAGQPARVAALTAGLSRLLQYDGPWADAIVLNTAAVRAAQQLSSRPLEANALMDLGYVQRLTGDHRASGQSQQEALEIYRDLGDRTGQANALAGLGMVRYLTYDFPGAAQALQEALSLHRDLGNRFSQASALTYLGAVQARTGDYPAAAQSQQEALGIYRDLGDRHGEANILFTLALSRRLTNDYPAAGLASQEALAIYRDLGDRLGEANALALLGVVRRLNGDYPAAARSLDEALGICRDIGDRSGAATTLNERGTLHRITGEIALAAGCHQQALEMSRESDGPWDEAHALAGLGRCALAEGQAAQGETLLREALEIFRRIGAAEAPELLAELEALGGKEEPPSVR
jgi:tetratricopeptide (TPR) repeat protein/transcriptional regulator with XRE-family HTH domain